MRPALKSLLLAFLAAAAAAVLLPSLSAAVGIKAVPGQAPGHPQQVLVALKRYGRLLARPAVDTALQREKQSLTDMVRNTTTGCYHLHVWPATCCSACLSDHP